jgi:hypothetical protein
MKRTILLGMAIAIVMLFVVGNFQIATAQLTIVQEEQQVVYLQDGTPVVIGGEYGSEQIPDNTQKGYITWHKYYKRWVHNLVGMELFSLKADGFFKSNLATHKIVSINDALTVAHATGWLGYSYTNFQKFDSGIGTDTGEVFASAIFHLIIAGIEIRYWDAAVWVTCNWIGQSTHGSDGWN